MENKLATQRLEAASKGIDLPPLKLDPAIRIPSSRFDTWQNLSTGFGNPTQHRTNNSSYVGVAKLSPDELEELYRNDWVARNGVDAPAEDMTRKGISYVHGDEDEDQDENAQKLIEDFDDILNDEYMVWSKAEEAISLARASGGSLCVFNFDDINSPDQFRDPLNINRVKSIRWIKIISAFDAIPISEYKDINNPNWGKPEHYQVIIREFGASVSLVVHESRMIRMDGRFSTQRTRIQNRGWNDSEIQAVYTALRDYGICVTQSTANLESFTQDYLGMKGLAEKVMLGETDYILERAFLAHSKMTSNTLSIYDADSEKMDRQGTPVTGLADLWDRFTEIICGAWRIPRSRFLSSESGALGGNAAESDTRNYFNRIHSNQEKQLRPWLNKFMMFVNLSHRMLTELPSYTFNPLQEQSEKEKADTRYTQAQTDQIYIQNNVLSPEEIAISRFSKDDVDLESVVVDFDARKEMRDEESTDIEEIRNLISGMQNANKPDTQEEKQDSVPQIIEFRPEIKVESPVINNHIPEQHDYSGQLSEMRANFDEIKTKLDQDIDFED